MKTLLLILLGMSLNCASQRPPAVNAALDIAQMMYMEQKRLDKKYPNGVPPVEGDSSYYHWQNTGQSEYNSAPGTAYSGYSSTGSGK